MHPDKNVDSPPASSSRWLLLFLVVVAAFLAFVALTRRNDRPAVGINHSGVGGKLESLEVKPLLYADEAIHLSELRGKLTLINFWGPWCPPCLAELPEILELEKKYRGRDDVAILLISSSGGHGDTLEELRTDTFATLSKQKADPPIYEDEDEDTIEAVIDAAKLDRFGFPTTLLIDQAGTIRAVWSGYGPSFVHEMETAIEAALAESKKVD